jgi:hypothetical protein
MAVVDPDDDGIRRYLVRRYAYDEARHERRHQIVAAFDNEAECLAHFDSLNEEIGQRKSAGEYIDPREYISGTVLEPGHARMQRNARDLRNTIERRVPLSTETWERLTSDLPRSVAVARSEHD